MGCRRGAESEAREMNYRTSLMGGFEQECVQMVKAKPHGARGVAACQGDWMHAEWSPNQIPESERARSKPGEVRVLGTPGPGQDPSSGFPAAASCSADHHCASFHSYHLTQMALHRPCSTGLSAMMEMFSACVCLNMVATSHMWLLST